MVEDVRGRRKEEGGRKEGRKQRGRGRRLRIVSGPDAKTVKWWVSRACF